ncbi:hypothetical protein [Geoalkalibacter halelectricus]|uniref:hypothetical protein n=1 Tax=Geoalkalibacter halelectricus TaxID=2847045 RepID=UPI003D1F1D16
MDEAVFTCEDDSLPSLEKGMLVVFSKAISFGTFEEKRFVVVDPRRSLFRAQTLGDEVKILSTFFRIYDFELQSPQPFFALPGQGRQLQQQSLFFKEPHGWTSW